MATEVLCPICGATYNIAETQLGRKLRCKKCEHAFVAGDKRRGRDDDADDDRGAIRDSPSRRPAKAGRRDDDYDDDDRPRKKTPGLDKQAKRRGDEPKFPVKAFVIAGAILGALLLVCGGGGLILSLMVWDGDGGADPVVVNQGAPPGFGGGPMRPAAPPANPPDPLANPFRPVPALGNVDEALALLRGNDGAQRLDGARWLAQKPVDAAKQAEVAKALNGLLGAAENPNVRNAAVAACKAWATAENVPGLISYLEGNRGNIFTKDQRVMAMQALARVKDERGAAVVAHELTDFHTSGDAQAALRDFGKAAEKAVARMLFHPEDPSNQIRDAARGVLRDYGTKEEVVLDVALADLKAGDDKRQQAVLKWLGEAVPNAAKMADVSKALVPLVDGGNDEVSKAAVTACKIWATAENVPGLVKYLERYHGGKGSSLNVKDQRVAAMRVLGRLKDERGAAAVANELPDFFTGGDALSALRDFGKPAEKAVAKMLFHPEDPFGKVQETARGLLRGYGTKDEVVLPFAVEALRDPDKKRRDKAADWFEKTPGGSEAQRGEVSGAINLLLDDPEREARLAGARMARTWGTKDNVPSLIKQLEDRHLLAKDLRAHSMKALAALKDERGVFPVAAMLGEFHSKEEAAQALRDFGPVVEVGAVTHLLDPDPPSRALAWGLLKDFGTQASVASAKEALKKEPLPQIKKAAPDILKTMELRPAPKGS